MVTDQPSRAMKRFRELVRERRALLPRKERADADIYEVAALRQVLEQVSAEMSAGIVHDDVDVKALLNFADQKVEAKRAQQARTKPRFRGVGR